jgi:hypothetical protein
LIIILTQQATALRSSLGPLCRTLGGNCGLVIKLFVVSSFGLRGRRVLGLALALPFPGFLFALIVSFDFSMYAL